jgi:16S rRNA (cytosine967-C5)-methyltransferase
LQVLRQVREGKPFEAALDRVLDELPEADRRLAHELAAGVLRRRTVLDSQLAPLVSRGWSRVGPDLQDILRLGAYQLTELDRVPAHAAVDTSVALAKDTGGARVAGFVNAVLRGLTRSTAAPQPKTNNQPADLAQAYSHPVWLVERWIARFGPEQVEALLQWNNHRPRMVVQPARESLDRLRDRWQRAGLEVEPAPYGAGLIPKVARPAEIPGYHEGHFIVQDPAQALLGQVVNPSADAVVYDACAAPGGKTITLGRTTRVVAGEISRHRSRRLAANLERAGSGREHLVIADARHPPLLQANIVLLDAPCLGTGTFARHPDARWRVSPAALERLVQLQTQLLESTASIVAPGGVLIYSTCSLEPEENLDQVETFLSRHKDFHRERPDQIPPALLTAAGDFQTLPQIHGVDGAFATRLRRSG